MNDDAIQPGIAGAYSVVVADEHVPLHLRGTNAEVVATPKGMRIEARARLIEREGRRCVFQVEIHDEVEVVARGENERFIVPRERTNKKLMRKIEEVEGRGVSVAPGRARK